MKTIKKLDVYKPFTFWIPGTFDVWNDEIKRFVGTKNCIIYKDKRVINLKNNLKK